MLLAFKLSVIGPSVSFAAKGALLFRNPSYFDLRPRQKGRLLVFIRFYSWFWLSIHQL